jgi:beta-lactam-binding protein with PASTA domain
VNLQVCEIPNVPDLSGDTPSEASAALQRAGLVLGTVRTLLDPACISIGRVLAQDPAPRATATAGSAVAIWTGRRDPSHPCRP